MMIPLSIAEQLQKLAEGEQLSASKLKHAIIDELLNEGIISVRIAGRTRKTFYLPDTEPLNNWLFNKYSIHSLDEYIRVMNDEHTSRSDLVAVSNNSKAISRRTFKGFLVNSYMAIDSELNGAPFIIEPVNGTFQFVYDFERFVPAPDVVIVGVENAENFRRIKEQQHLFADIKPLFVCRYPQEQSKDMIKWLLSIPNTYLHFGDYDLASINIYLQEYKKHLVERATFFIPPDIEPLLEQYGNGRLYDQQHLNDASITEPALQAFVLLLHKYKKGMEQEALII
jgi:hypothetical protein